MPANSRRLSVSLWKSNTVDNELLKQYQSRAECSSVHEWLRRLVMVGRTIEGLATLKQRELLGAVFGAEREGPSEDIKIRFPLQFFTGPNESVLWEHLAHMPGPKRKLRLRELLLLGYWVEIGGAGNGANMCSFEEIFGASGSGVEKPVVAKPTANAANDGRLKKIFNMGD